MFNPDDIEGTDIPLPQINKIPNIITRLRIFIQVRVSVKIFVSLHVKFTSLFKFETTIVSIYHRFFCT